MNLENKDEKPVTELTTGIWNIELLNGTIIPFYYGTPEDNPLKSEPEFDQGDNWSIDAQPEDFGDNEFEIGEDGFVMIPKIEVKRVFFKVYGETQPAPQIIGSTHLEDIIKKSKGVVCYNCGKAIPVGKTAIVVTSGTITEEGFTMDEDPWMTIACDTCGSQINEVIGDLNTAFGSLG